jgi:hypothetical protein
VATVRRPFGWAAPANSHFHVRAPLRCGYEQRMADEMTVPLLPCRSIDDIAAFYGLLGFRSTYRQQRPNPYVALQREDLHLHFFGMADFVPADSYGTCLVVVPDVAALHRAFATGLRTAYGTVPVSGIPRMTRPRARKNQDGMTGFSVVDPGGNWIRVTQRPAKITAPVPEPAGPLAKALQNAVVQADSRGDHRRAARILDSALARPGADDDPVAQVEVLVYRAEVALALHDPDAAGEMLARADGVALTAAARQQLASTFEAAADLAAAIGR